MSLIQSVKYKSYIWNEKYCIHNTHYLTISSNYYICYECTHHNNKKLLNNYIIEDIYNIILDYLLPFNKNLYHLHKNTQKPKNFSNYLKASYEIYSVPDQYKFWKYKRNIQSLMNECIKISDKESDAFPEPKSLLPCYESSWYEREKMLLKKKQEKVLSNQLKRLNLSMNYYCPKLYQILQKHKNYVSRIDDCIDRKQMKQITKLDIHPKTLTETEKMLENTPKGKQRMKKKHRQQNKKKYLKRISMNKSKRNYRKIKQPRTRRC